MRADINITRAERRAPPRVCRPGNVADSGGWSGEREEKGVGHSESISAHTVITTTENSGHDVHSKYNEQSRTRARGWYVDRPRNNVAIACKQNASSIGKTRAGKCLAYVQKGHAQVGAWCAQTMKYTRTQRVLLMSGVRDVCGGVGCVWNMNSAQSKERAGDLCLDHLGCGLSAQVGSKLFKYSWGFWF